MMNKVVLLLSINLLIFWKANGQDRIVRKNGKIIKCKITLIDTTNIEFKFSGSPGKIITTKIIISDVASFIYDKKKFDLEHMDNAELYASIKQYNFKPHIPVGLKITRQKLKYNDEITFEITELKKWGKIYTGSGYYYSQKGFRFFALCMTLENISNEKQMVDFNQFFIVDTKSKSKYQVQMVLAKGAITRFLKFNKKLKPAATLEAEVTFTCPDSFTPQNIMVNEKIYNITYSY